MPEDYDIASFGRVKKSGAIRNPDLSSVGARLGDCSHMAMVGSAASAQHGDMRKRLDQIPILPAQFKRMTNQAGS